MWNRTLTEYFICRIWYLSCEIPRFCMTWNFKKKEYELPWPCPYVTIPHTQASSDVMYPSFFFFFRQKNLLFGNGEPFVKYISWWIYRSEILRCYSDLFVHPPFFPLRNSLYTNSIAFQCYRQYNSWIFYVRKKNEVTFLFLSTTHTASFHLAQNALVP